MKVGDILVSKAGKRFKIFKIYEDGAVLLQSLGEVRRHPDDHKFKINKCQWKNMTLESVDE